MSAKILLVGVIAVALVVAACAEVPRAVLQMVTALPTSNSVSNPPPTQTPGFSMLATPTLDPIAAGPLGTWTAIALTIAPPTIDARPYVIVNQGNPHFIEFHAWW